MTSGSRLRSASVLAATAAILAACSGGGSTAAAPPTSGSISPPTGAGVTASTATPASCRTATSGAGGGGGGADVAVPGDISDTVAYITFHSPDGYHVDHPEGWAQSQTASVVTITDKFNSIRVEISTASSAPTVASAQAGEVATVQASANCFEAGKVSQVTRKSGVAVLITYRADSPPDPVTGKSVRQDVERYEFWQAGRQATITLSSPKGSDNVDPWRKVTDSFGWSP